MIQTLIGFFGAVAIFIVWLNLFLRPSWLALKNTWGSRHDHPKFFSTSVLHEGLVLATVGYLYFQELSNLEAQGLSENFGPELFKIWLIVPALTLPASLLGYFAIKHFAKNQDAWCYDLAEALSRNSSK